MEKAIIQLIYQYVNFLLMQKINLNMPRKRNIRIFLKLTLYLISFFHFLCLYFYFLFYLRIFTCHLTSGFLYVSKSFSTYIFIQFCTSSRGVSELWRFWLFHFFLQFLALCVSLCVYMHMLFLFCTDKGNILNEFLLLYYFVLCMMYLCLCI